MQNPLLWQLEDLFGFFGKCGVTRTILLGDKSTITQDFLLVCSYFLRCTWLNYPPTENPGTIYISDDGNEFKPIIIDDYKSDESSSRSAHSSTSSVSTQSQIHVVHNGLASPSMANANGTTNQNTNFTNLTNPTNISESFCYSLYGNIYGGYVGDMALMATSLAQEELIPKVLDDLHVSITPTFFIYY